MVNRKTASALTIATLLACAVPVKSVASSWVSPTLAPVIAQAASDFPLPTSVPKGTEVRISSSSDNMNSISAALKAGFEGEYANSQVNVTTKTADEAINDVLNDNADVAAISRPLTAEEKAKGLAEAPVRREKIAIVVDSANTFSGSITGSQFAQIFRGEIKDWSEVGGTAGPIKLIDRPATSETRQALKPYPVFTTAPFEAADGATTIAADTTEAVVEALGPDGISYVLVDELAGQSDIKAVQLHQTPPTDPRYPFSQPYSFVYAQNPAANVSAFLGYATGNPGQAVVNAAGVRGVGTIPDAGGGTTTATAGTANGSATGTPGTDASGNNAADGAGDAEGADGTAAGVDGAVDGVVGAVGADGTTLEATAGEAGVDGIDGTGDIDIDGGAVGDLAGRGRWWWLLLPLAGLGLLIWAAGKRGSEEETAYGAADRDNRIRSNYEDERVGVGVGAGRSSVGGTSIGRTSVGGDVGGSGLGGDLSAEAGGAFRGAGSGLGKMAAGGAAIAGGAAAAGTGLMGRMKGKAGDVTTGLRDGVSGAAGGGLDDIKGGIDGVKGAATSGVSGLRGGVQDGIDGVKGAAAGGVSGLRGGIDGIKGNVQGGVSGLRDGVQGGVDGLKGNVQGGVDGLKGNVQGGVDGLKGNAGEAGGSWLDRAKQRINEATENVKDTAADVKNDGTNND